MSSIQAACSILLLLCGDALRTDPDASGGAVVELVIAQLARHVAGEPDREQLAGLEDLDEDQAHAHFLRALGVFQANATFEQRVVVALIALRCVAPDGQLDGQARRDVRTLTGIFGLDLDAVLTLARAGGPLHSVSTRKPRRPSTASPAVDPDTVDDDDTQPRETPPDTAKKKLALLDRLEPVSARKAPPPEPTAPPHSPDVPGPTEATEAVTPTLPDIPEVIDAPATDEVVDPAEAPTPPKPTRAMRRDVPAGVPVGRPTSKPTQPATEPERPRVARPSTITVPTAAVVMPQLPAGPAAPAGSPVAPPRDAPRATAAPVDAPDEADTVLAGLYKVRGVIDEDDTLGTVLRMHHRGWNVDLAVEAPPPALLEDAAVRQAVMHAAGDWIELGVHPDLVTAFYVRSLDEALLIFRELVDGGTLEDAIAERSLYARGAHTALERILSIARQTARGLGFAHSQGVYHRDLSPRAVLLDRDGHARLVDFGIHAALGVSGHGHPLPPELADDPRRGGGAVADVWSWALMVLSMFAGEVPRRPASDLATLLEDVASWADLDAGRPMVPADLIELLTMCLAPEPDARPAQLDEICEILDHIYKKAVGRPWRLTPVDDQLVEALTRNNRGLAMLDLGRQEAAERHLVAALEPMPGALFPTYNLGLLMWRAGRLDDRALLARIDQVHGGGHEPWEPPFASASIHMERGDIASAAADLQRARSRTGGDRAARARIDAAREACRGGFVRIHHIEAHETAATGICVDARAPRAVTVGRDAELVFWDLANGEFEHTVELPGRDVTAMAASADLGLGVVAVRAYEAGIYLYDLQSRQQLLQLDSSALAARSVAISAAGDIILGIREERFLVAWDSGGDELFVAEAPETLLSVALSPDGSVAAVGDRQGRVGVWNVNTGRPTRGFAAHAGAVEALALDRSRTQLVSGGADGLVRIWDLDRGALRAALSGHTGEVTSVAVASSGRWAASGSVDATVRIWSLTSPHCVRTLEGHAAPVRAVDIGHGDRLVTAVLDDGTMHVWRIDGPSAPAAFLPAHYPL